MSTKRRSLLIALLVLCAACWGPSKDYPPDLGETESAEPHNPRIPFTLSDDQLTEVKTRLLSDQAWVDKLVADMQARLFSEENCQFEAVVIGGKKGRCIGSTSLSEEIACKEAEAERERFRVYACGEMMLLRGRLERFRTEEIASPPTQEEK